MLGGNTDAEPGGWVTETVMTGGIPEKQRRSSQCETIFDKCQHEQRPTFTVNSSSTSFLGFCFLPPISIPYKTIPSDELAGCVPQWWCHDLLQSLNAGETTPGACGLIAERGQRETEEEEEEKCHERAGTEIPCRKQMQEEEENVMKPHSFMVALLTFLPTTPPPPLTCVENCLKIKSLQ